MTGPEHYREAELLLAEGCEYGCPHSGCEHEQGHLARAQVHATLANAAATALGSRPSDLRVTRDDSAWHQAAATKPPLEETTA
jgi:hypothetical protein